MPVFIIWFVNGPHGGWATLEIWTILFILYSERFFKREVARQNAIYHFIWGSTHDSPSFFRGNKCCFVINLKWVEHTGPYLVHSQLLINFTLISTFFKLTIQNFYKRSYLKFLFPTPPRSIYIIFFWGFQIHPLCHVFGLMVLLQVLAWTAWY